MQSCNPRSVLYGAVVPLAMLVSGAVFGQGYPSHPIRMVVPFSAGAGVTDVGLEMQYVTPIPGINPSIGTNSTRGSQVSMGGKANCLKPMSPIAANAKFIVKANAGAGVIAAQLYSK